MATAPCPFPFPVHAATYPPPNSPIPTQIHGYSYPSLFQAPASGYHHPPPFSSGAPPVFPYAAPYPYPPLASAYTPAFPHAAAVPYAPPASAYALAPDFSPSQFDFGAPAMVPISSTATATPSTSTPPAPLRELPEPQPALWPPPPPLTPFPTPPSAFPYAAAYAHPPPVATSAYRHEFIPTQASHTAYDPNQPPPAPTAESPTDSPVKPLPVPASSEFSGDLSSRSPLYGRPRWQQFKEEGGRPKLQPLSAEPAATAPVHRPDRVPSIPMPCARSRTPSWLLDNVRTTPNQECTPFQSSVNSLHGELSKLSALVSQLAVDMGLQTTEELVTDSSSLVAFAQFSSPATTASVPSLLCAAASSFMSSPSSPLCASLVEPTAMIASTTATNASMLPADPAYVASQVFDKMATPSTSQEIHGSAPEHHSGHHTPTPSTLLDGNSNLQEQNVEGMPEAYGLHNLICQTIVRADGTEHHYYVLPETYPLVRATPQPVFDVCDEETKDCSNEFHDVFTSSPKQLALSFHKAPENASSEQLKVFSTAPETEHASACLNITSDVRNFTLELQLQDDEKTCHCPVRKASNSVVTSSNQIRIEHIMRELRLLWDPGALLPLMSSKPQHTSQALQPTTDVTILAGSSVTRFSMCKCLPFWVQTNIYVLRKSEVGMATYISWDPGILKILDMMLDKNTVPNNIQFMQRTTELSFLSLTTCKQHMTSSVNISVLQDTSFILQKAAHFSQGNYLCFLYCKSLLKTEYWPMRCLWEFSVGCRTLVFQFVVPTHVLQQSCYCSVPSSQENNGSQFLWDPGILSLIDILLAKTALADRVHSSRLLTFIAEPVNLKQLWAQLLLQSHSGYNTPNVCLQVLCYSGPSTNGVYCTQKKRSIGTATSSAMELLYG